MNVDWEEIKEVMSHDIGDSLKLGTPSYPNLNEGIELFKKVIFSSVGGYSLGGLKRELPNALQEGYITKVGKLAPLKAIATSLEPYLKKICIILNLENETNVNEKHKTLSYLLERLNITSPAVKVAKLSIPSNYIGQPNYLEHVCEAYQTRNKVHESPDFKRTEVINKFTSIMIVYIFAALKYKNEIEKLPENISDRIRSNKTSAEEKFLYHFISYSNTTNKIKNQLIISFILNYLQENNNVNIEEIRKKCNDFFNSRNLQDKYYENIIKNLATDKKVTYFKSIVSLTDSERDRIERTQLNFETNKKIFITSLEDIRGKFTPNVSLDDLFKHLLYFIECNYNIDIAEAYDKGIDIVDDENKIYTDFVGYIIKITGSKEIANALFIELMNLCKDSDFLLRMCAGNVFAKLTNPERFENYINLQERIVYLDTQIILFVLCASYANKIQGYFTHQYEMAEDLLQLARKDKSIVLKVSRLYLQEIAYQLKMALMLIPFEGTISTKISNNVFYQFYYFLKENDQLNSDDETFAFFMENLFNLYEDDIYDNGFWSLAYSNLISILSDNNIEVEQLPQYDNKNIAFDLITNVLDANLKDRSKNTIDNDAIMLCHLCNSEFHVNEPFFLTWDKEFAKFRKKYIEVYKRTEVISFHLFSPAKFINHISLLNFKIDPQSITNGFISIMDTYNFKEEASSVWDVVNKYLNIDGSNGVNKRKQIQIVKSLFENEFGSSFDEDKDNKKVIEFTQIFDNIIIKLNEYFTQSKKHRLKDYRDIMTSEVYFKKITIVILNCARENNTEMLIDQIGGLISEFKQS